MIKEGLKWLKEGLKTGLSELFWVGVCFDKVGGCWEGAVYRLSKKNAMEIQQAVVHHKRG
jgi:hypothetical protein